ncbi:MAG: hypothetical protein E7632_07290 [Ruminococcaceae bacterium]|nr:hypothetical protein [Oscillospiraceae bacterium]
MKNLATTITFCALIGALTVASMVNPVREYSDTENRALEQMPEFSLSALFDGSFTRDYESFITDQFVARDAWIGLKNRVELAIGKKDSGGVYFGKDGYLIEKHEYDAEQAEKNLAYLAEFLEAAAEYNPRVLIAPTASLILADKLPTNAPVWDQAAFLDRCAALDGFVDIRETLTSHVDEYIFYRTDHHWTTLGAYYAYADLCESLGITPLAEDSMEKVTLSDEFVGTLAAKVNLPTEFDQIFTYSAGQTLSVNYNMGQILTSSLIDESKLDSRDKYGAFLSGNQPIADVTTDVKNGKTLLVIKDSYAHCMAPLLTNHYERVIFIDLRHLNMGVATYLALLESEGTQVDDIVVLYNAENVTSDRNLHKLMR